MSRILFVPTGPIEWNSPRLRCYWIAEAWDEAETWGGESWETALEGTQVLVMQQKMMRPELEPCFRIARARKIPIIWDTCDPNWWWDASAREMAKRVDFIVASTDNLAALAREELNKPSICIPDRHKVDAYAVKEHKETDCPVLMWTGWLASHASLWNCAAELFRLAATGLQFKVLILDDTGKYIPGALGLWNYAKGLNIELDKWEYSKFFQEQIIRADIGLVPLYPGVWNKYKSNNKEVAFWCAGIPTTKGDDLPRLAELIKNAELRAQLGNHLRDVAIQKWSIEKSVEEWKNLIAFLT